LPARIRGFQQALRSNDATSKRVAYDGASCQALIRCASTQNQALHALLFLYRHVLGRSIGLVDDITPAKRGRRLPTVLAFGEVRTILSRMRGVPRLCASLMYGSGLRVSECTQLRVKDVDVERGEILVRCGKGDRDRRVPLPRMAVPALRVHLERTRRAFERDLRAGVSGAPLPNALARKLPSASRDWCWQYVFPAARVYVENATGKRRRHHLHETAIQRAFTAAARSSGVSKRATCHSLRHSSRPTCWRVELTFERFSRYSAIRVCRRR
jgi:integrase